MLVSAGSFNRFVASVVELLDLEGCEVVDGAVGAFGVEPEHPGCGRRLNLIDVSVAGRLIVVFRTMRDSVLAGGDVEQRRSCGRGSVRANRRSSAFY